MVRRVTTFECETCGLAHFDYDEARGCELGHITDKAVQRVSEDIRRILRESRENPNG